jgi:hypothetical protein
MPTLTSVVQQLPDGRQTISVELDDGRQLGSMFDRSDQQEATVDHERLGECS